MTAGEAVRLAVDLFRRAGLSYPDDTWDWNTEADAMRKLTVRDQEQFGADFPDDEYDTIDGLVTAATGHLPEAGQEPAPAVPRTVKISCPVSPDLSDCPASSSV